jgi:hypothetical protein
MSKVALAGVVVVVLAVAVVLAAVIPNVVPLHTAMIALRQGDPYGGAGSPEAATVPPVGPAFRSGLPYSLALQAAQHAADARWFLVVLVLLLAALALGLYTLRIAYRPEDEPTGGDRARERQAAV